MRIQGFREYFANKEDHSGNAGVALQLRGCEDVKKGKKLEKKMLFEKGDSILTP
jgi:hypothetical protein